MTSQCNYSVVVTYVYTVTVKHVSQNGFEIHVCYIWTVWLIVTITNAIDYEGSIFRNTFNYSTHSFQPSE